MDLSRQYRNKITKLRGSEDMDLADKNIVRMVVRDAGLEAKFNWFFAANEHDGWICQPELTEPEAKRYGLILHRPDVAVYGIRGLHGFIEIDGAAHSGKKRDWERDRDYELMGIPCVVANKADLAARGEALADYVAKNMPILAKPARQVRF